MKKASTLLLMIAVTMGLSNGYMKASHAAEHEFLWEDNNELPMGLHLFFNSGYQHSDLSPLNAALQKQNYSPLGPNLWSSGGAMQLVAWRMIYEVEGQVAIHAPINNPDYQAMVMTGNSFFNVGYEFKPVKALRIYPLLGIGASFLDVSFTRRSRLPSFDEFLSNPGWNGKINNTLFALNVGVGLELQGWLGSVGLRGGYIFHPMGSSWWGTGSSEDQNTKDPTLLSNGPEMALNGPYLKLVVGF